MEQKFKLRIKKNTNLKPTWVLQTSVIRKTENLSGLLRSLPADAEYDLLSHSKVEGHYHVVFSEPVEGIESGFVWEKSVEVYDPNAPKYPEWNLSMDFPSRIIRYMMSQGHPIVDGYRERNIIYLEGIEPSGKPNSNKIDAWNDVSVLISFDQEKKPYFVFKPKRATSEPGLLYTNKPLNPRGAFRIAPGYHASAWYVDTHGWDYHPALRQAGEITGYRDLNKDGKREGDEIVIGSNFAINQHGPYSTWNVGKSSAGCLVRASMGEHLSWMHLVERDPRFLKDKWFRFGTTIIIGRDFANSEWGYT